LIDWLIDRWCLLKDTIWFIILMFNPMIWTQFVSQERLYKTCKGHVTKRLKGAILNRVLKPRGKNLTKLYGFAFAGQRWECMVCLFISFTVLFISFFPFHSCDHVYHRIMIFTAMFLNCFFTFCSPLAHLS
jgi:hypothetical protein